MSKLDIKWSQFHYCNDDQTKAFEDMCRRLFSAEFLKGQKRPHTDHNTPGVEVLPILEPERDDGQPSKIISFQAKYVDQPSYAYSEFKKSAKKTAKKYKGKLDLVYLFCNKTLTTTSKPYQEIVKIHRDAGIETEPISDVDLLDMINDYPDIAEYFFQKRKAADTITIDGLSDAGLSIDKIIEVLSGSSNLIQQQSVDAGLAKELIAEKLELCKKYALSMELEALEKELQKLFSDGQSDFEGAGTAYFYSLLLNLHRGTDFDANLKKCDINFISEAKWIIDFYRNPKSLSAEEFVSHSPVIQIFIAEKLFTPKHWQDIITLWETVKDYIDPSIKTQFDLFYGLSLFNIQEYGKAKEILCALVETTGDEKARFYACITDIRVENSIFQAGMAGHHEKLVELLSQLESFNKLKQYRLQEELIASIKMETLYHLGISEKVYLDQAIEEYAGYSEETRKYGIISFYYALCLEMNGNRDEAIEVYSLLNWKTDDAISERYMICCILNGVPDKAISIYNSIDRKTGLSEAAYLFALEKSGADNFFDVLSATVNKYKDNLEELIKIAFYTDCGDDSTDVVLLRIKELLTETQLKRLPNFIRINLIIILSQRGEITMLEAVLNTVDDISSINSYAIGEIYKALFDVVNQEYKNDEEEKVFIKSEDFEIAERIADSFLAVDSFKKYFLQIKVICTGAKRMPFSSLKYSKELFEIIHDEELARNIVALLFDRKETNPREYAPYLEILEQSEQSNCCMAAASANLILGKEDVAKYHAYRALYYLNNRDDFSVFKRFFGFCNYNLHAYQQDTPIRSIKGGVVVTLEENSSDSQAQHLDICLDTEAELSIEGNRSMGIEHIIPSDPEYIKLHGCGLNQVISFRGRKYKIIRILSRMQYGLSYIFKKIQEQPEMFHGAVWMITAKDTGEMLKQIRELTDNTEQINTLLDFYHFKDNSPGIPLDMLVSGDYGRYIEAVKYLLFSRDEAFYAGLPLNEDETNQRYVPLLSTFVLLSILGRIDVLDAFKSLILIPESYIGFIQEEFTKAVRISQTSSSTLFFIKDKPVMKEIDKSLPEIWESIYRFCNECTVERINDQERIDSLIANEIKGEQLFSELKVSFIHLDALILAQKENATFLCDDLFFRKVATWMNIRNLNIVSLIQHNTDLDFSVPIIKELSKTNYIHVPILYRNDEEFEEIIDNLINGEKKKHYFDDYFRPILEAWNQNLKQGFEKEFDKG